MITDVYFEFVSKIGALQPFREEFGDFTRGEELILVLVVFEFAVQGEALWAGPADFSLHLGVDDAVTPGC